MPRHQPALPGLLRSYGDVQETRTVARIGTRNEPAADAIEHIDEREAVPLQLALLSLPVDVVVQRGVVVARIVEDRVVLLDPAQALHSGVVDEAADVAPGVHQLSGRIAGPPQRGS